MKGGAAFPIRLRYTKHGKIRWISHRDVARALERAFRVTQLPLAFTEGFSPRPKVSFGLALSTGHESDGEYLDVVFARPVGLDALPAPLSDALPEGMDVTGAAALVERAPALQEVVTAVDWLVEVDGPELQPLVDAALAAPTLVTQRRRKGREVAEDIRPVIRQIDVLDSSTLLMQCSTQPRSAKPTDVLAALSRDLREVRALRTHQWIERDGARCEPLDADTRPTGDTDAGVGTPRGVGAGSGITEREQRDGSDEYREPDGRWRPEEAAAGISGRTPA